MTAKDFIQTYGTITEAKRVFANSMPVLEAILKRAPGERMTAKEIGIELMGEKYTEKTLGKYWNGHKYATGAIRSAEAHSMSSTIGAAFDKLERAGLIYSVSEYDKTQPYVYETEDFGYFDKDGKRMPDAVEVTLATGEKLTLSPSALPGVERKWTTVKKIGYPKVRYWILK